MSEQAIRRGRGLTAFLVCRDHTGESKSLPANSRRISGNQTAGQTFPEGAGREESDGLMSAGTLFQREGPHR